MADLIKKVLAHLRGMWRFRWPALVVAWLVALAGWLWTYTLPNQYETTAQVYVNTDTALRPLLEGLSVDIDVLNQVEVMTRSLLSRPVLEDVARKTDLDLRATTPREQIRLIERMEAKISIVDRGNNIYLIGFRDRDPGMTHDVVQELLNSFMGDALIEDRKDAEQAEQFLEEQIKDYEMRLNAAESRLAEFKKRNVDMMPGSGGDYYERLKDAKSILGQLDQAISLKLTARREMESHLQGEEPTFGLLTETRGSGPSTSLSCSHDATIAALEANLSQLRLSYTEKHPDVIGTLETIAGLQAQCEEELAGLGTVDAGSSTPTYSPLDLNPVYQGLKMQLSATEVELSELYARREQQRVQVATLQESVDTVPEVEAQLARLNRDYDVTRARYNMLLERLENARMGSTADDRTSDVKFRIIEPPNRPIEPIGPNRLAFLVVTLMAGLAAGLGFTFMMDQLRPVYITRHDLSERTGLPVLGAVGVVLMPQQRAIRRMQTVFFAMGILALLVAFGVAVSLQDTLVALLGSTSTGTP